jgi:Domain of unknown function (DUF397)
MDVTADRAGWRKSSYSGDNGGACVEVAGQVPSIVALRDSKNPAGLSLSFASQEWHAFAAAVKVAAVKVGEFDLA